MENNSTSSADNNKIMAVLCYIFAPIVGLFFLSNTDADLKWHAKQSLVLGLANIAVTIGLTFVSIFLGFISFGLTMLVGLVQTAWVIAYFVIAIYAAVQAYNGKKWAIPGISQFVK